MNGYFACLLHTISRKKNVLFMQAFSVKVAGYWSPFPFACLWTSTLAWSISLQKWEPGQSPAFLTSCLVNNLYIFFSLLCRAKTPVQSVCIEICREGSPCCIILLLAKIFENFKSLRIDWVRKCLLGNVYLDRESTYIMGNVC